MSQPIRYRLWDYRLRVWLLLSQSTQLFDLKSIEKMSCEEMLAINGHMVGRNDLLALIGKVGSLRCFHLIQMWRQNIEAKEAHFGRDNHRIEALGGQRSGRTVADIEGSVRTNIEWIRVKSNRTAIVTQLLLFSTTTATDSRSHSSSATSSEPNEREWDQIRWLRPMETLFVTIHSIDTKSLSQ